MKFISKRNEGESVNSFIFYQLGNHIQLGFRIVTKYSKRHLIFGYSKKKKNFYFWNKYISKVQEDLQRYLDLQNCVDDGYFYAPYIPIYRNNGPIV